METSPRRRRRQPVHHLPLPLLLIIPILLAIATGYTLFIHSDDILAMLFSQCHARSRLPIISHIPVLGAPLCFLVSFFQEALASVRAFAIVAAVLAAIAGLLTVSTVESARVCNAPSPLLAYPTGAWLVFNLVGGALVWELAIVPAHLRRARGILEKRRTGSAVLEGTGPRDPDFGTAMRHLHVRAEVVAVPVGVAAGYVVPSVAMLVLGPEHPAAVVAWLVFPVWVSLVRQVVRALVRRVWKEESADEDSFHLESSWPALLGVYFVPVVCSALAQGLLIFNLVTQADDRKEMTRAALKFIIIDVFFISLTVLYWLLVEAGWRVTLVVIAASVLLGPGAGLCVGWIYREGFVDLDRSVEAVAVGSNRSNSGEPEEETPLLRG